MNFINVDQLKQYWSIFDKYSIYAWNYATIDCENFFRGGEVRDNGTKFTNTET